MAETMINAQDSFPSRSSQGANTLSDKLRTIGCVINRLWIVEGEEMEKVRIILAFSFTGVLRRSVVGDSPNDQRTLCLRSRMISDA
jgi:hypothetical protein